MPKITDARLTEIAQAMRPFMYEAGRIIMAIHADRVQSGQLNVRQKDDGSPVTEADEAAEALLLPALAKCAPDIPIISEENAASHSLSNVTDFFLVDPIDGTKEFLKTDGTGAFTVNIGLVSDGVPILGLIYAPAFDALYEGVRGGGAVKICAGKTESITVRHVPKQGAVAVASASHRDELTNQWLATHYITRTKAIGSSLKLCLVAEGTADVYPRFGPCMEWDTAAGDAILRAAGGTMTTPDGAVFAYGKADYLNTPFIASGKWQA